jgi:hypothetical protein
LLRKEDRNGRKNSHDPSEAFVETLMANCVTDVFGIVGSANMDALDIFPAAGIGKGVAHPRVAR